VEYALEYFDRLLCKTVSHKIEADTTKKAVIAAEKILEHKIYDAPDLYTEREALP
jgi:hypothetical protein